MLYAPDEPAAKNIILMIGDGMGLTQISAGIYANGNRTEFERFNTVGIHKPYSSDQLITDSAAGATAFACGQKTFNGAIAVDQDTVPLYTILEEAEARGLATGLIATSSLVHATPACFIAHNKSRTNYEEIAADFLQTEVDYMVGGGLSYFANRKIDSRNLIDEMTQKGYVLSDFIKEDIEKVKIDPSVNFGYFTANAEPLPRSQDRNYLSTAVKKGLEHLSRHSENGFFLMIEGSQIDWGGHANDLAYVLQEYIEFDAVIGEVLDWSEKNRETLVIVTADHETGGLAIQPESTMETIVASFTSTYHTGSMVPVFAKGPREKLFGGIYENTEIYYRIRTAFGW